MDTANIVIDGKQFKFVRQSRRGDVTVYTSCDLYARVGEKSVVEKMLALHQKFESFGFPVPAIAGSGEIAAGAYYLEKSLGEKHFSELFREDIEKSGAVSEGLFEKFLAITETFARAQLRSVGPGLKGLSLAELVRPEDLAEELPEYLEEILRKFEEAVSALKVFPPVLTQGDFNSHNLFPDGVIDFEKIYCAPYGYDLVTNIFHISQFPDSHDYEYYRGYSFSKEQEGLYYERLDRLSEEAGLPRLSDYRGHFEYCRAIWSSARNGRTPKLQKWRYDLFKKDYLL